MLLANTVTARPVAGSNKVRGCHVTLKNMVANTTIAAVAVSEEQEDSGPPTMIEYGHAAFFSRPYRGEYLTPDIRVRVYTTTRSAQGTLVLGEMRQVYACYNPLVGYPRFGVHAKPFQRAGHMYNSYQYASFGEKQDGHFNDLHQGTYVFRSGDSKDHKIFLAEVQKLSTVATHDYPLSGLPY